MTAAAKSFTKCKHSRDKTTTRPREFTRDLECWRGLSPSKTLNEILPADAPSMRAFVRSRARAAVQAARSTRQQLASESLATVREQTQLQRELIQAMARR